MTRSHGWRWWNTLYIYKEDLLWVWTGWGFLIISTNWESTFCTHDIHSQVIESKNQGVVASIWPIATVAGAELHYICIKKTCYEISCWGCILMTTSRSTWCWNALHIYELDLLWVWSGWDMGCLNHDLPYSMIIQVRNQENAVRPRTGAPPQKRERKKLLVSQTIHRLHYDIAIIMTDGWGYANTNDSVHYRHRSGWSGR